MSIFSGLEKFGLKSAESVQLFGDEQKESDKKDEEKPTEEKVIPEEEFLLAKTVRCKVCDQVFKTKVVKNGRVKRLEPDQDLRPRFQYIDTLKYDVTSCPNCGYTAMNRYFDQIMPAQVKLIKEQIVSQFKPINTEERAFYTYDEAIDRYKLSLMSTVVKRGKDSEKAFTCLKIAWLLRGKAAFDGFSLAISKENYPMCGMEQNTLDYLLAYMAFHFKQYEVASKFLSSVLTSPSASRRMKDVGLQLKEDIIAELKK